MSKSDLPLFVLAGGTGLLLLYAFKEPLKTDMANAMDIFKSAGNDAKISALHPAFRPLVKELIKRARDKGIDLLITEGDRSWSKQAEYYAKGRTTPGPIITNAKPGESFHNFQLAVDVVPIVNGKADWNSKRWDEIGQIGKSLGLTWGGDFKTIKDKPHFEKSFGSTLAQLRTKHNNGLVDSNGFVNLT